MSKKVAEIGRHFGKADLDRIGYFHDPVPLSFDSYEPSKRKFVRLKKRFVTGPTSGLFDTKFKRLFVGEALNENKSEGKKGKLLKRAIIPSSPAKFHSTPGDWFGCIGKQPERFNPSIRRERKRTEHKPPNFKIKPNPLGGPGYADICFNPYPKYVHEPYESGLYSGEKTEGSKVPKLPKFYLTSAPREYFGPNPYFVKKPQPTYVRPVEQRPIKITKSHFCVPFPKKLGGNKDGCFHKFPRHISETYRKHKETLEVHPSKMKWLSGGPEYRSKYTTSIIEYVTKVSCNGQNYPHYVERVFPLT